jgi:LuxR family maltose regulon positive regulatory protein
MRIRRTEDAETLPGDVVSTVVGLTERQTTVLRLLATGASYPEIARHIRYSVSTVRNDAVSIYRKLGVRGRSEAAARAVSLGLSLAPAGAPDTAGLRPNG